ncbi:DUF3566 domain-containing protein [Mycobacterium sp. IDR2000157661]|uniref:DUF3566 domain-containing protein n=1 Tax=Mycobacterium sp. IDR2000157661 TaxID=2867005 RepID=UPI001EEDACF5|nr:DUF3566 domain-containing protein [Mycobacterium sp. IDR2000157661]ULE34746.1 DUF3566 domain-containing protein [Mycobacterium sp. IDR2000157661]
MSSPNEPGYPRAGEGAGVANGSPANQDTSSLSTSRPNASESGDVPPWQRGPAARSAQGASRPAEQARRGPAPRGDDVHGGERPDDRGSNHSPGADSRLNRYMVGVGSSTPTEEVPARDRAEAQRSEPRKEGHRGEPRNEGPRSEPRTEAYASELPDLSGPLPRPPQQQRTPADRPAMDPANRPAPAGRVQVGSRNKGPVRASMQIRRVDPWSTLKVSLVLSVALFFVWMIAVAFLYLVLGGMGVWSKLNSNVGDLLTSASGTSGGELVSSGTIFGGAALIGLVNIVLLTAMATVGAFIYNLTTDLVGGVEVTLADRD